MQVPGVGDDGQGARVTRTEISEETARDTGSARYLLPLHEQYEAPWLRNIPFP